MSRICELTGKKAQFGNVVSNANNKRRTRRFVNLNIKRFYVPELKTTVRARFSNRAIRTIDKLGGLVAACRKYEKSLSPRLSKVLGRIRKVSGTKKKADKAA